MVIEVCEEMQKLRKWLDEQNIEWKDDSDQTEHYYMARTKFLVGTRFFSVINGDGSYGGKLTHDSKNFGLLECSMTGKGIVGDLTCEDVVKMVEEYR